MEWDMTMTHGSHEKGMQPVFEFSQAGSIAHLVENKE